MGLIFKELHNEFGTWPLAYIPYGGADFGQVAAVARVVGEGDDSAFYDAWVKVADRLAAEGQALATRGRTVSARELFLRASCFYQRPTTRSMANPSILASSLLSVSRSMPSTKGAGHSPPDFAKLIADETEIVKFLGIKAD